MKIRSFVHLLALSLVLVFCASSCIEVVYETTINEDGSGTQVMTVDMENFLKQLYLNLEGENDLDPEVMQQALGDGFGVKLDSMRDVYDSIPGLHNFSLDYKGYEMITSVDFDSLGVFSTPEMDSLWQGAGSTMRITQKGKKKELSWKSDFALLNQLMAGADMEEEGQEKAQKAMEMLKGMYEGMEATTIFHLPGKVTKVSDKANMKVSKDKKTVMLRTEIMDILEGKVPEEYFIQYK